MEILLFDNSNSRKAVRFIRRHRERVRYILVVVDGDSGHEWRGGVRAHYGPLIFKGLILLH